MKCTLDTTAAKNAVILNYFNRENKISNEVTRAFSIDQFLRISFYEQRVEALNASQTELVFEMRHADRYEDNAITVDTKCYEKDCQAIICFNEEENDFAKHYLELGIYDENGNCTTEDIDLALLFNAQELIKAIDALLERHEQLNYVAVEQ